MSEEMQNSASKSANDIYENLRHKIHIFKLKLFELEQKFERSSVKGSCAPECDKLIIEFEEMEQIVNNEPGLSDRDRDNLVRVFFFNFFQLFMIETYLTNLFILQSMELPVYNLFRISWECSSSCLAQTKK